LAYVLAIHTRLQANGVYMSMVVAESLVAIAGVILFRRGKWKLQKI
jgi:Na+-driven multidrug efflux pump